MALRQPRTRLVYFRISEDEFRQFSALCETAGARSISDLARNAVRRMIEPNTAGDDGVQSGVWLLLNTLGELNERLKQLTSLLEAKANGEAITNS